MKQLRQLFQDFVIYQLGINQENQCQDNFPKHI